MLPNCCDHQCAAVLLGQGEFRMVSKNSEIGYVVVSNDVRDGCNITIETGTVCKSHYIQGTGYPIFKTNFNSEVSY